MHRPQTRALFFICVFLIAAGETLGAEPLRYELRFERPNTHLLDVAIHASGLKGATVEFAMPDWAPGSYSIQNYAGNVQRFRARNASGKELGWRKTDSQTWRIEMDGANEVMVDYQVFANTLQNNMAQYDERHAFIGGPSVWMYLVNGKERPIELSVAVPQGWKVATGMEDTPDHTFGAADYDWFADAPLEISDFAEKDFQVSGTTYHVIVHDVIGGKDFSKFVADVQKIVETSVAMWSAVAGKEGQAAPFRDYWFMFHIWPKSGGGLEHLNSTQINFGKDWDDTGPANSPQGATQYELKLFVTSHEFFHAWNVKRLRPKPLGPFDYTQMVHTPSLWIAEGLTSYYGWLNIERAGVMTPQKYLDGIAKLISSFEEEPGRQERSIEDTSWDTWFPNLRQANNLANTSYSYYDGGQIMGHILDFAIRESTHNQKSLDDWMRLLYSRYALPKLGYEPADAVNASNEVAGRDIAEIFVRNISGKEQIPYEKYFAYAGIAVEKKFDRNKPWIGISTEKADDGHHASIKNITPGSPAETAGLDRSDIIIAMDNRTVDDDGWNHAFDASKPGEMIHFIVARTGEIKEIAVPVAANPYPTYSLKPVEHPTDEQKAIYESWLRIGNKP